MQHAARPVPNSFEADAAAGITRPARVTLDKMTEHLANNDRKAVRMSMLMLVQFLPPGHAELVRFETMVKQWDAEDAQKAAAEKAAQEKAAQEKAAAAQKAAAASAAAQKAAAEKAANDRMAQRAAAEKAAAQRAVTDRSRAASSANNPAAKAGARQSGKRAAVPPGHTPTGGVQQPDDDINAILSKINLDDPIDDPLRMPSGSGLNVEMRLEDSVEMKKPERQPRSEDVPVLEDITGAYSVFVHGVPEEKRPKAIELIVEFRKCSKREAEDLVKRTVVPVVKNVPKKTADNALTKFSREGIKGRIKQER